jgi:hypothetical protein
VRCRLDYNHTVEMDRCTAKELVSSKLLVPLMEDRHALLVNEMFKPSVVNCCAEMQAFFSHNLFSMFCLTQTDF